MNPDSREKEARSRRTAHELAIFIELGKTLTSTLDIKEVLKVVMSKVSELMNPRSWSLLLADENTGELTYEVAIGRSAAALKRRRIRPGEGVEGWVAREGKPLLVNGRADLANLGIRDAGRVKDAHSLICVPLRIKGKTLGVIEVTDRTDRRMFRPEDLTLLGTLADYAAIAIENAKNFQRVEELTITDELTRLYNARHLHNMLDYEIVRSIRHRLEFSLVFLDIDHFKGVNDQYGHLAGSKLLREIAGVIASMLRKLDVGTRYGGDEFVILLPQTPKKEALKVATRMRDRLASTYFLQGEGLNVKVTASFGIAAYPTDALSKSDLLRLADQAMYRVKNSTRNGVALA
jgi:diguanylate cyclase (GGDEF)-like protein